MKPGPEDERQDEVTGAARDWVLRLASGDLGEEDLLRFRQWLTAAASHRAAFEAERRFWSRLGAMRPEPARPGRHGWAAPRRGWRFRRVLAGALAAACLAAVLLLGTGILRLPEGDYRTAEGGQRSVTLPDGSVARLNTDTAIALDYAAGERRVRLLRGEALFEVVADRGRPFRVAAAKGVTEAIGTAFVVRIGPEATTVTVTEGTVGVTAPAGATPGGATVRVAQGQRTSYRDGEAPLPVAPADGAAALWRQGIIRIDDLPLDEALAELDRYRPGRILLLGSGAAYRSVSGAFDVGDVDGAIAGLAATHGLRVTMITPYLVILR